MVVISLLTKYRTDGATDGFVGTLCYDNNASIEGSFYHWDSLTCLLGAIYS
jgi:hypothetical protein